MMTAQSVAVGVTDFGEEVDDFLALRGGFHQMPCTVHLIVSGGDVTPTERLAVLKKTLPGPDKNVLFYLDEDEPSGLDIATSLEDKIITHFINNGPLSKQGLTKLTPFIGEDTRIYLVGGNGGVNVPHKGADEWKAFLSKSKHIIEIKPDLTRKVLIPTEAPIFKDHPALRNYAKRTAFMFFASRFLFPKALRRLFGCGVRPFI